LVREVEEHLTKIARLADELGDHYDAILLSGYERHYRQLSEDADA